MPEHERQYDFPIEIDNTHTVGESVAYDGDKFTCESREAYTHTGAWPTFNHCPYCGTAFNAQNMP